MKPIDFDIVATAVNNITCPYCGASRGGPCRTRTGRRPAPVHVSRVDPITRAYGAGYTNGYVDGQQS